MRRPTNILLILFAAYLAVQAVYSTRWQIAHDEAPLLYEAFLMRAEGLVPYRDFFDFQMPGSFLAYFALGSMSGFSAFRLRLLDLFILSTLLVVAFFTMRRFGKAPAFAAAIFFGLKYLQGGPTMSLQREYLLLVFLAPAVYIFLLDEWTPRLRLTLGVLFGLSALIKPHAAIGLIPMLAADLSSLVKRPNLNPLRAAFAGIFPIAIGFFMPILAVSAWLGVTGALTSFLTVAANYWPLYSQINGQMEIVSGAERIFYLLIQTPRLGGYALWLIPAAVGVYFNQNKKTWLLVSLAFCYAVYPTLSGQFFPYHYIPFAYFIILLAPLALNVERLPFNVLSFILFFVLLSPSQTFLRQLQGKPVATSADRAVQIVRFLDKNLKPGDTVQPLDWTGGSLLAMLETRARLATPYVFDFYFYHHVSNPYIQSLRSDFMNDLQTANPRFVIEVAAIDKPWVSGPDASREFPELREFLNSHYSVQVEKEDYLIYERR
jgi:hypothetical protein